MTTNKRLSAVAYRLWVGVIVLILISILTVVTRSLLFPSVSSTASSTDSTTAANNTIKNESRRELVDKHDGGAARPDAEQVMRHLESDEIEAAAALLASMKDDLMYYQEIAGEAKDLLARKYYQSKNPKQASEWIDRALNDHPSRADREEILARSVRYHTAAQNYDAAATAMTLFEAAYPLNEWTLGLKAKLADIRGEDSKAIASYEQLLNLDVEPQVRSRAYTRLASLHQARGKLPRATELLQKKIAMIDPVATPQSWFSTHRRLLSMQQKQGRYADSFETIDTMRSAFSSDAMPAYADFLTARFIYKGISELEADKRFVNAIPETQLGSIKKRGETALTQVQRSQDKLNPLSVLHLYYDMKDYQSLTQLGQATLSSENIDDFTRYSIHAWLGVAQVNAKHPDLEKARAHFQTVLALSEEKKDGIRNRRVNMAGRERNHIFGVSERWLARIDEIESRQALSFQESN